MTPSNVDVEGLERRLSGEPVHLAIASHRAGREPSLASRLGLPAGVAIARCASFIAYNAPALVLGFIAGVLAVVVPACVIARVIS